MTRDEFNERIREYSVNQLTLTQVLKYSTKKLHKEKAKQENVNRDLFIA